MSAPSYREYAPREEIAPFVHCVWTFRAPEDCTPQPIAPDGRAELIVNLGAPYAEVAAGARSLQAPVIFAGQITRPLILEAQGAVDIVAVRFRPDGARGFLGADVSKATDARTPLAVWHGAAADRLGAALKGADEASRVALIQDYVAARVRAATIDLAVRSAVEAVFAGSGAETHLSERALQRRFKRVVGVSPRMLRSIVRFRRVFDMIERPEAPGWVGAALAAGYFDQPQMARDFRRFLGVTARQWAAQQAGLATSLAAPQSYKMPGPPAG